MVIQQRPAVHRTIVVVDVESFGDRARTNTHQVSVRAGMYHALRLAFDDAGIPWSKCEHEDRGDGVFIRIPAEVPKSLCSERLPQTLVNALRIHNSVHSAEARIRLRMVLHAGDVNYDDHGVTAVSVNLAFRLLDAAPLKAALANSPGVLALVVSDWFYDEIVRHSPASNPASFRRISLKVKETAAHAWIALPDYPYPPGEPAHDNPAGNAPRAAGTTARKDANLSTERLFAIVDALEAIPCLRSEYSRAMVLDQLPSAISGSIPHHPQRRAHLMNILRSCLNYDGGLRKLLAVVTLFEQDGSITVRRLTHLLDETWPS
jgi:hypothetical protein